MWEPSQVGTWLGFHLDFSLNIISVPVSKISKLQESIPRVHGLPLAIAKDLAGIAGQLNSMFFGHREHCAFDHPCNVRSDFGSKVVVFHFFT